MREVASDFNLIHDYASQTKDLNALLEVYGSLFLTRAQSAEFKSKTEEEHKVYLQSHAADKPEVLWYFVVSLCRLLQTKDYQLRREEAYWLGVVDEVTGSGLQSDREMIEMIRSTESATRKPLRTRKGEPWAFNAGKESTFWRVVVMPFCCADASVIVVDITAAHE